MSDSSSAPGPGWRPLAGIGAALFLMACVIWVDAYRLPPAQAVGVGPSAAMRLVSVALVILAVCHWAAAWQQWVRRRPAERSGPPVLSANAGALAWIMGGLLGLIGVLELGGGFIIGSTWLFAATARAFGQPLRVKSPLIGFVLACLVYLFFTQALSLALPAGPLERLLG